MWDSAAQCEIENKNKEEYQELKGLERSTRAPQVSCKDWPEANNKIRYVLKRKGIEFGKVTVINTER